MPTVSIIAGSKSDLDFVKPIEKIFTGNQITFKTDVISAHRDADKLKEYVTSSDAEYFIALAGLAAALPGCIASHTKKPVIGVPLDGGSTSSLAGLESLLAIIQMPPPKDGKDVAVGCVAINHPELAAQFIQRSLYIRNEKDRTYDVAIDDVNWINPQNDLSDNLERALNQLGLTHTKTNFDVAKVVIALTDSCDTADDIAGEFLDRYKKTCVRQMIMVPVLQADELKALNYIKSREWVRTVDGYSHDSPETSVLEILNKIYRMAPSGGPAVAVGSRRIDNAAYLAKKLIGN
jgi:5-(carboxyamino)imidazole ribonucleotide mutase